MLNNRLEDLIYQYQKYRKKRFLKSTLIFILPVIVTSSLYILYDKIKHFENKKDIQNTEKTQVVKNEENKTKQLPKKREIKPQIIEIKKVQKSIDEEKILNKNSIKTLMLVEKRKPTYETALDLANYYFKNKNYKKASKWAVVASNREPKYEDAWLIYAKSKIKLGQKGMAKKALKIYLLKYHSQKVTNLLNSL